MNPPLYYSMEDNKNLLVGLLSIMTHWMVRLQNIRVSIWFLVLLLLLTYWTEADCAQPFQTFNFYKSDHFHSNSILTLTWKGHWYTTISLAGVLWGSITTVQCKCWLDCRGPRQDPACSLLPGTGLPQPGHTGASARHVSRVWRCVEKVTSVAISF